MTFLGDSHGFLPDISLFPTDHPTVHVGDLGIGFGIGVDTVFPPNFSFIRGNHDDPSICQNMPTYLGDFGVREDLSLGFISGALSKDREKRIAGVDWWENEELSYVQFAETLAIIEQFKPKIIVSHDAPSFLFKHEASVTRKNLQFLFEHVHRPQFWVYGHHHYSSIQESLGTTFIGLDINEFYTIEI